MANPKQISLQISLQQRLKNANKFSALFLFFFLKKRSAYSIRYSYIKLPWGAGMSCFLLPYEGSLAEGHTGAL